jgi:hypothetical protein
MEMVPVWPFYFDRRYDLFYQEPFIGFSSDTKCFPFKCTRRTMDGASLRSNAFNKGPDSNRTIKIAVTSSVVPRSGKGGKEHYLQDVTLVSS